MAKDHDFKRLVRERMQDTGERYTQARAALVAQRDTGDRVVSDRTRSLVGQLADVGLAAVSRDHLARLRALDRDPRRTGRGHSGKAGRFFRREMGAGGREYWVAPPGTSRPRIP
jgi:hypothetical protein